MATKKSKYQDGGAPASFRDQKKSIKQANKLAALTAKGERIKAGTEPTLYDKAATITGNVAKVAGSAADVVNAVKKKPTTGGGDPFQKGGAKKMQMGGAKRLTTNKRPMDLNLKERAMANRPLKGKKYQDGGSMFRGTPPTIPTPAAEMTPKEKRQSRRDTKKTLNYVKKNGSGYNAPTKGPVPPGFVEGRSATPSSMRYKTGGMVNANAKLVATKSAGSKGVKAGVNPKAAASKVARGRSGGTSAAPKKATPGRK